MGKDEWTFEGEQKTVVSMRDGEPSVKKGRRMLVRLRGRLYRQAGWHRRIRDFVPAGLDEPAGIFIFP